MGVYVTDGVLLGAVLEPERCPPEDQLEALEKGLRKIVDEEKIEDEAHPACYGNNPYESHCQIYLGVFWQWSNRRALSLDDEWRPLFKEMPKSEETLSKPSNRKLQGKVFELLKSVVSDLKPEEVKYYEVRRYD